ncbi:MAG: flagellar hook basal-body protein [Polyangiaceae bacterium]|jgi:flagellar basal body rod protein FlgG|nr:flagellar hook basal-body protein [Polyangiaceae bacterium]
MSDGIYIALSGAVGQLTALDITAQNLANSPTGGYQAERLAFREALARVERAGEPARYAAVATTVVDSSAGVTRATGRGLDVALAEGTYLAVGAPGGERYTRAGALYVDATGSLHAPGGVPVLGEDGKPLRAPPGVEPSISPQGELVGPNGPVGRLRLVTFARPESLQHEGGSMLATNATAGEPKVASAEGSLRTGTIEDSNVSVVRAMNEMIRFSRAFEAFERTIHAFHEADRRVVTSVPSSSG